MATEPAPQQILGYVVKRETWTIAGCRFDLAWPADMDALLDSPETQKRFHQDEYMPYWAQPWPGSVLLAQTVLGGEHGRGRSAVEIGCGIGLVSIAAAYRGWRVIASDYDDDAIAFARLNAAASRVEIAGFRRIDYRVPLREPAFERILGSDLLYERCKSEPLARWIASALLPGGLAILSDPNRAAADGFPEQVRQNGLDLDAEAVEMTAPWGSIVRGRIFTVRRPVDRRGT